MSVNTAWMDRALCVGDDPDIYFDGRHREEAQRICGRCSVAQACREAGAAEYRGVWGGEPHTRKSVGPSPSADYIGHQHGTPAGYSRHLREGTPPCGSCSAAHAFANQQWERKRTPEQLARQRARRRQRGESIRRQRSLIGVATSGSLHPTLRDREMEL